MRYLPSKYFHGTTWKFVFYPYTYVNIYMANEVYFSLHGAAVVKQISLNPNDLLFTCNLTEGVWKHVKILRIVNGNHNLTH